ncbi:S8 family serine peptidase [Pluralibacter gergoviae]
MANYLQVKKTSLAAAIVCCMAGAAAQAAVVNDESTGSAADAYSLGTQSKTAAEKEQSGDDLKLSPYLYRVKERVAQGGEAREGVSTRSKRSLDENQQPATINVDIIIDGNIDQARGPLSGAGFTVNAVYGNSVGGTIAAENLEALSKVSAVKRINMPEIGAKAGEVENQADFVQFSKKVKSSLKNAPGGKGLTIGILSTSWNCLSQFNNPNMPNITAQDDVNNGELPGDVYVVKETSSCSETSNDEGRAMAQLVHDIAPDAKIAYYSPDTLTDFAQGIQTLAMPKGQYDASGREGAGANIIVDDLYFFAEPFYETGIVGDSITRVVKQGVPYFVAGGNFTKKNGGSVYRNNHPRFVAYSPGRKSPFQDENAQILQVSESGSGTILPVTLQKNRSQKIGIWWDQSYAKGNQSKMVACLTKADGSQINGNEWCLRQPLGQDPIALMRITLPRNMVGGTYGIQLFYTGGVKPGSITVMGFNNVSVDPSLGTSRGTIYGHTATPAAFTLGAADFADTPQCGIDVTQTKMEAFSSYGNSALLFDIQGNSIHLVPNKPDATAVDGVSTSFFSGRLPDPNNPPTFRDPACNYTSEYTFHGTSAAAPNAAAAAALIMQDNPGITPEKLYKVLRQTATTIGSAPAEGKYNYVSGYGLINTLKAIETLRAERN